ncbi:MAG: MFS transporter [Planctomycetota bacterium]
MKRPRLPPVVWALGAVSFCSDVASEMIVPLLPVFLAQLGGTRLDLGLLQGASDLCVAALKLLSGWISDHQRRRKPWMLVGYGLSALLRPLFAVVATPWQAVAVRTADRVGKGLRSAPRDALLSGAVDPSVRGRAFGVVRGLDHAGAVLGALLAALLLAIGVETRTVFALALLPGVLGVLVIALAVRDAPAPPFRDRAPVPRGRLRPLRPFLVVVALSAFGAGTDLFVLARAGELGTAPALLPILWAVLHAVRSLLAAPLGGWSDRLGRRRVIAVGLVAHAAVLGLFGAADGALAVWLLMPLLGLHAAFTEGAERGLVADLTGGHRQGTAFGVYHAVQGLAGFAAPLALGALWDRAGAGVAFGVAAATSALAAAVLLAAVAEPGRPRA